MTATPSSSDSQPPSTLFTIPPEIREQVYRLILHPDANRRHLPDEYSAYDYTAALALFKLNKQIYHEARKVFRDLNVFVQIATPWPQAKEHVESEGHVPIVMREERAEKFKGYTLKVGIDAPLYGEFYQDIEVFVILVEDLPKFTKTWLYSNLTYPSLNSNLRLTLELNAPFLPDWEEKIVPRPLQRRLLLPFGDVKSLRETVFAGTLKPLQSIESELRGLQAIAPASPEHCLREATRFKGEGNAELQASRYQSALESYKHAWEAMHIVIAGSQRHLHADAYFDRVLTEPPYEGKSGGRERLILRIQLVANTCAVYLKLNQWENCRFWGMRSIRMIRDGMGIDDNMDIPAQDEAVVTVAAPEMGKIYYRTAIAYRELDDKATARRLLRVAKEYLPRDRNVDVAIASCALQLG